jgi:hypothetical protein
MHFRLAHPVHVCMTTIQVGESGTWHWLSVLLAWQVLSLMLTGTGVFSQLLSARGVDMPTAQSFCVYALLSVYLVPLVQRQRAEAEEATLEAVPSMHADAVLQSESAAATASLPRNAVAPTAPFVADETTSVIRVVDASGDSDAFGSSISGNSNSASDFAAPARCRGGPCACLVRFASRLRVAWWKYALLALVDVEANYLVVRAYQYTTIESVALLDCFAIPCVMALSAAVFAVKYRSAHIVGVATCLGGLALLVVSDIVTERNAGANAGASSKVTGDVLTLCGAALYAVSNLYVFGPCLPLCFSVVARVCEHVLNRPLY